jgi:MATE family multidrug resistance protein
MAVFIARLGTTPVAGHQIAANLVSLLFMLPMALSSATSTLVAQRVGARDGPDARRLGWHGMQLGGAGRDAGASVYLGREAVVGLYTRDAAVAGRGVPLLAWVALFHIADAAQSLAAFVLRAYRIATLPMLIFAGVAVGRRPGRRLRGGLRCRPGLTPPACAARRATGRPAPPAWCWPG